MTRKNSKLASALPRKETTGTDGGGQAEPPGGAGWLAKLGPGLITGAADDDPSGIATYSQAGAKFGYDMGWTLLLTYPLMVGIQLASARIGRVSGRGLTEAFLRLWPRWIVWLLVGALVVANVINLGADLNAMADVSALVAGGSKAGYAIGFGVVSLALQIWLPYERYVRVLKWLTLSLFSYVAVAFTAHVDWAAAAKGAMLPHLQWNKDFITTWVAILGTTISPYLFFWQAAQEVEEIKRVPHDQALRRAPAQVPGQLRRLKIDTWVGMGFSNAIAFFMIIATAATLHAHGQTSIETTAQAAQALKPVAGEAAFVLFGMGVVGTGLLALPVLAGSAAYALASLLGVRKGLDRAPGKAPAFYAILAAAMLIGLAIGLSGISPMTALVYAAIINALASVPIMIGVMLAASSRKVMGDLVIARRLKIVGWSATGVMLMAAVATLATAWS